MKPLTTFIPAFIICIAISPMYADESGGQLSKFNCTLGDGTVATVEVLKKTIDDSYSYDQAGLWGVKNVADSNEIISSLKVEINGKRIFVPLSAYGDLGNPNEIGLSPDVSKFDILIKGGQHEKGYLAVLTFDFLGLLIRKVSAAEFPEQVWAETIYTVIDSDSGK